ncbi:MAG: SRPBCC family protein [Candidatus Obscuribacterales bacterium]|nr:SRPBCC family protein [Candidatus Obscuribacterales bacterium]
MNLTKTKVELVAILSCSMFLLSPQECHARKIASAGSEEAVVTSEKRAGNKVWHTAKILIKAPPKVVWDTVHEERKKDPDLAYSKVLEQGVNECRLEQRFVLIPVIGAAVCEMHNSEIPGQRIDYKLLKSDRFKSMEGSWILTPTDDGHHTVLELSTHLDLGMPVPGPIMNTVTSKKLARRLDNVKKMAEHHHAQVAAQSGRQSQ